MKQYKADKQARLNQIEQIEQYQTLVLNGSSDITTFTRSIAALPVKDDCNAIDLENPPTALISEIFGVISHNLPTVEFPTAKAIVSKHSVIHQAAVSAENKYTLYHQSVLPKAQSDDTKPTTTPAKFIVGSKDTLDYGSKKKKKRYHPIHDSHVNHHKHTSDSASSCHYDMSLFPDLYRVKGTDQPHVEYHGITPISFRSWTTSIPPNSIPQIKLKPRKVSVEISTHIKPQPFEVVPISSDGSDDETSDQEKGHYFNDQLLQHDISQPSSLAHHPSSTNLVMQEKNSSMYNVTIDLRGNTAGPPRNFLWTEKFIYHKDIPPRDNDRMFGCSCKGSCAGLIDHPDAQKCDCIDGTKMPYSLRGLVRIGPRECMIKECNDKCSCNASCPNRVSQRPSMARLDVFWCGERGWGVRTKNRLPAGAFVSKYFGEVITEAEAASRNNESREYHFAMDFNEGLLNDQGIPIKIIDAYKCGNVSRFFNHSCVPNMASYCVQVDSVDPDVHHIAFFTVRPIAAGEELTFDYSNSSDIHYNSTSVKRGHSRNRNNANHSGSKENSKLSRSSRKSGYTLTKCLCGSDKCRGTILST
ncbi:hypothetical protein BDEG_21733 [Batrachochytrium dendrobatidis JEL423]|uniref:Histone-lysine N-methyltransferase n=1 Tax=Batrachochytrium dendrobatidis (strain JEL423) TaxID=403673 RepID=A0A177WCI6_BATDL|nr:hypothetical protein BDEG_21733 [Batrachochytrium dendrobatidis JEL423]